MLTQTQIKDLARREGFYLKKSLGQNFIIDKNLRDKIIRLIAPAGDETILEIGPGLGALTEPLAEAAKQVYAVEKDRKIHALVKDLLKGYKNLEVIHADFLRFDIPELPAGRLKVVGALPFYITTVIIQRLIETRDRIDEIYIIVQKEVARRIVAKEGDEDYSSLSLFVRFYSTPELILNIKKGAFFPVPTVDTELVKIKILPYPSVNVKSEEIFSKVVRQSFGHRRKTILTGLSHKDVLGLDRKEVRAALERSAIDPSRRPETLSIEEFGRLSDAIVDFLS